MARRSIYPKLFPSISYPLYPSFFVSDCVCIVYALALPNDTAAHTQLAHHFHYFHFSRCCAAAIVSGNSWCQISLLNLNKLLVSHVTENDYKFTQFQARYACSYCICISDRQIRRQCAQYYVFEIELLNTFSVHSAHSEIYFKCVGPLCLEISFSVSSREPQCVSRVRVV